MAFSVPRTSASWLMTNCGRLTQLSRWHSSNGFSTLWSATILCHMQYSGAHSCPRTPQQCFQKRCSRSMRSFTPAKSSTSTISPKSTTYWKSISRVEEITRQSYSMSKRRQRSASISTSSMGYSILSWRRGPRVIFKTASRPQFSSMSGPSTFKCRRLRLSNFCNKTMSVSTNWSPLKPSTNYMKETPPISSSIGSTTCKRSIRVF